MKLFQLPVRILLALVWILFATESVRSQSNNMSDITLPSTDAMISEPDSSTDNGTSTEDVSTEETDTATDEATAEETDTATDDVTAEDTDTTTDDVTAEETDTSNEEVAEETDTTTDDVTAEETDTSNEEVAEETDTTTDDVTAEETDTTTDDVTAEDTDTTTEDVTAEETDTVNEEVVEDTDTSNEEVATEDTDTNNEVTAEETDTATDEVAAEETDTTTDEVTAEETDTATEEEMEEETDTFYDLGEDTAGSFINDNDAAPDVAEEVPTTDVDPSTQGDAVGQENPDNSDTPVEETPDSDVVDTSNTEPEIVDSELKTLDQEDAPSSTDAEAIEENIEVENSVDSNEAESNEIVEELLEEAELREINNSQETEEVVQEETVQEDTEETAEQEATEEAVVQEETEEVTQDDTTEEEVVQEETEEVTQDDTTEEDVAEKEVTDEEGEVAEEEVTDEEEVAEEEVAEEQNSESEIGQLDRAAYETQFQEAPNDLAILMQEEFQLTQLIDSSGIKLYGSVPSVKEISRRLAQLAEQTGKKPAFINISLQSNQLESFVVLPEQTQADANNSVVASSELNSLDAPQTDALSLRKTVEDTSRKDVIATATNFREEISDIRKLNQEEYKASAQELYNILIKPIEAELEANDIDVLVFSMDSGLRLLPVAALHDGEQFLIEKYAMGIVPSFGLTDTRYVSPESSTILAMGASEFEEQISLPTMPLELQTIVSTPRRGESFLNEQFTIPNFVAQNSRETPFSIIHLGTHAKFKAGNLGDSYIQFYDDKLNIPQLQRLSEDLGWNSDATPVELLVLSACETALGNKEAELGFAGLAVQAGVKSALASLWYVSDLGTLALMGEFYDQLGNTLIKAEALRQTQLEMLHGNVKVDNQEVKLSNGEGLALSEDFPKGTLTLDHPYFWSSFTLIGNWN